MTTQGDIGSHTGRFSPEPVYIYMYRESQGSRLLSAGFESFPSAELYTRTQLDESGAPNHQSHNMDHPSISTAQRSETMSTFGGMDSGQSAFKTLSTGPSCVSHQSHGGEHFINQSAALAIIRDLKVFSWSPISVWNADVPCLLCTLSGGIVSAPSGKPDCIALVLDQATQQWKRPLPQSEEGHYLRPRACNEHKRAVQEAVLKLGRKAECGRPEGFKHQMVYVFASPECAVSFMQDPEGDELLGSPSHPSRSLIETEGGETCDTSTGSQSAQMDKTTLAIGSGASDRSNRGSLGDFEIDAIEDQHRTVHDGRSSLNPPPDLAMVIHPPPKLSAAPLHHNTSQIPLERLIERLPFLPQLAECMVCSDTGRSLRKQGETSIVLLWSRSGGFCRPYQSQPASRATGGYLCEFHMKEVERDVRSAHARGETLTCRPRPGSFHSICFFPDRNALMYFMEHPDELEANC